MARIVKAKVLHGFKLRLTFDDGLIRIVDLEPVMTGPIFAPLRKPARFREVRVNRKFGCIEWPNGADLCPDALYHGHVFRLVTKAPSKETFELRDLCLSYQKASKARKEIIVRRLSLMIKNRSRSLENPRRPAAKITNHNP